MINKTDLQRKTSSRNAKKMGQMNIGRPLSEEHKKKISESCKKSGCGKWSKGIKVPKSVRLKQSKSMKRMYANRGEQFRKEQGKKISLAVKGIPRPDLRGENSGQWKGGVTPEHEKIRKSLEYKFWRIAIFKRDNYICQLCGKRGGKLQADHIKPFSLYPELRLAIDNGRTLCKPCHLKTDTWGGNSRKKIGVL